MRACLVVGLVSALCLFVSSCSTGTAGSNSSSAAGASFAYMISKAQTQVDQFSLQSGGSGTPSATLSLPAGFLGVDLAIDNTGQLYVALSTNAGSSSLAEIAIYPANSTGATAPSRVISFPNGTLVNSMVVDAQGVLYASTTGSTIYVYSSTATGAATPLRSISGSATGLSPYVSELAVDSTGNIYAAVSLEYNGYAKGLLVFGPTAAGNVSPTRTISYDYGTGPMYGVAVEPNGNIALLCTNNANGIDDVFVVELPPESTGSSTPLRTITTTPNGFNYAFSSLESDAAGNLYETGGTTGDINGFSPTASGTATPFVAVPIPVLGSGSLAVR